MKEGYISQNLSTDFSDRGFHIHIDAPEIEDAENKILRIVKSLEDRGNPGALYYVHSFIAGGQRKMLPKIYESHTPVMNGEETLDSFSASVVKNRENAIDVVNFMLTELRKSPGAIVELEQPVGLFNSKGWDFLISKTDYVVPIQSSEVAFTPQPTFRFEIHHSFSVPKEEQPPISLEKLRNLLEEKNVMLGGLFIFEKETSWGYTSNSFTNDENFCQQVEEEQEVFRSFLKQENFEDTLETLVELIVGIWKS
jgi:hypothetical protein